MNIKNTSFDHQKSQHIYNERKLINYWYSNMRPSQNLSPSPSNVSAAPSFSYLDKSQPYEAALSKEMFDELEQSWLENRRV